MTTIKLISTKKYRENNTNAKNRHTKKAVIAVNWYEAVFCNFCKSFIAKGSVNNGRSILKVNLKDDAYNRFFKILYCPTNRSLILQVEAVFR